MQGLPVNVDYIIASDKANSDKSFPWVFPLTGYENKQMESLSVAYFLCLHYCTKTEAKQSHKALLVKYDDKANTNNSRTKQKNTEVAKCGAGVLSIHLCMQRHHLDKMLIAAAVDIHVSITISLLSLINTQEPVSVL